MEGGAEELSELGGVMGVSSLARIREREGGLELGRPDCI